MVVPVGPAPEQASSGEPPPTSAAESAPVQRTSFSISLDINTNIVNIQGLVTSPHRTAKPATVPGINPDSVSCSPTELAIAGQESAWGDGDTLKGAFMGPEQTADTEGGSEPLAEVECGPEEVFVSGEEADTAQTAEEYEDSKQCYVFDETMTPLGDQEPATETKMDSTKTAQPADMAAPYNENHFEDKHALHATQAGGNKSRSADEGIFGISASGKNMVAGSSALEYVGTASEGAEAVVQGHGQECEGNDAIDKAIEDAIAEVQQAVAEDGS